jgi:mRNA interferase RelE/StbE
MSEAYKVQYSKAAIKQLQRLDKTLARRVMDKVSEMAATAKTYPHRSLHGAWSQFYKLRVSKYRVIYTLDHEELLVLVEQVGLRDDIYDV